MKKQLLLLALILSVKSFFSQDWITKWHNEKNFYVIQAAFNDYWKDKDVSKKGFSYKQFKRWEYFMAPRVVGPNGDMSMPSRTWEIYQEYLKNSPSASYKTTDANQVLSTTWQAMGPFGPLTGVANNGLPRKAGRDNFITFHPSVANTFWTGAPAGGLWKTTNNGASWSTSTDNLQVIGCSDLAIDPINPQNMYLGTGDGDLGHTYCVGVLTSTNGGTTWASTTLTFAVTSGVLLRRLIINPTNPLIVMAATSNGTYRTTNGAAGPWTKVISPNTFDLEFKPGDPNTVYAAGLSFSVSTNAGATFTQVAAGIPVGTSGRMNIAVTPANANYVYVLSSTTTNTLQGVYRSINAGTSFSLMASSPNILSSDCQTPVADGQGTYDLAFAASPLNANEIVAGGIGVWRSMDGGNNWLNIGCAYVAGAIPFIHADHHELEYTPSGTLYCTNDGGVYEYTGAAWNDLSSPKNIAQIYRIGLSALSPNLWISGHQDNGSNVYDNGNYHASLMGDGMDCFIDRTNDQNLFASQFNGALNQSTNGGANWNTCVLGAPGPGTWITPWKQDPINPGTYWLGKIGMYKSTFAGGIFWQACGALTGTVAGQFVTDFDVAPSNNNYVYVIHGTSGVYTSTNGGTSFAQSNTGLPVGFNTSRVIVHPTNPQIAWITYYGYSGAKVYKTTTGGTSWSPITTVGLPNLPVNAIVYEPGNPNDRIYIGMDVGVYYFQNGAGSWTLYNNGLPNAPVWDLEISPACPNKIRAATLGRGVYQVDIVPNAAPPVTAFNYVGNTCTLTTTLYMNDNSTNSPTSWSWSVTPAGGVTINTPTSQNPTITIANPGTYTISMNSTNGFGAGAVTSKTISVSSPTLNITSTASFVCITQQTVTLTASGAASYTWNPGGNVGPSVTYTPVATQIYTVTGKGANGCVTNNTVAVSYTTCTGVLQVGNTQVDFNVYPNPANDELTIVIGATVPTEFVLEMFDVNGKLVLTQTSVFSNDKGEQVLSLSTLAKGVYFLNISSREGKPHAVKVVKD